MNFYFRWERWKTRMACRLPRWFVCSWKGHVYWDDGREQFCERCFKTLPLRPDELEPA